MMTPWEFCIRGNRAAATLVALVGALLLIASFGTGTPALHSGAAHDEIALAAPAAPEAADQALASGRSESARSFSPSIQPSDEREPAQASTFGFWMLASLSLILLCLGLAPSMNGSRRAGK